MGIRELLTEYLDKNNYRELSKYAVKLTGSIDEAEDLMSDLIIAIYTKPEFQSVQVPLAYFKTCLRNTWINKGKHNSRISSIDPELTHTFACDVEQYQRELEDRQTLSDLQKMLSHYSPELIDAFIKYHLEDYSLQELAARLAMKPNTLSKQFSRMRDSIREKAPRVWGLLLLIALGRNVV